MPNKKGKEAFNSISHEPSQLRKTETQGFIYRVHELLRNVNSKAYEPGVLTSGPYHHNKDSCKMMEEHKLRYLQSILNRRGETTAERYIGELEQEARNCYAEPFNLDHDKFVKMLVLDGCFIIELVRKFYLRDSACPNDPIFEMHWIRKSLKRDLILFENQIPFFVLHKLFDLIEGPNPERSLMDLLSSFFDTIFPDWRCKREKNISSHDIKHLLHLIYCWWIPAPIDVEINLDGEEDIQSRFIHSATELKDANVKFEKMESFDSLFEVKFQNGVMIMPPLKIGDRTESFFRNLMAYEQYFPSYRFDYVADYVRLMDLIINSSKDVGVLSECGIIHSRMGDNEVIASIFNKLSDSIITLSRRRVYSKIFKDINTHYNKRCNRWMGILKRDYFGSPWAYISLAAAFTLLVLTIVQTVCSIIQAKAL